MTENKPIKKKMPAGCMIAAAVIGLGFAIWIFSGGKKKSGPPEKSDIVYMAQYFVKQSLKSPKSADFSNDQYKDYGDSTYDVWGTVDAVNSFNASIRGRYAVKLQYRGGNKDDLESWNAVDVKIE